MCKDVKAAELADIQSW